MRKKPRFHSLKKIKVRQDWSRWTLYNLSRLKPPNTTVRTYFQQKWTAKSDTRAYHGEHIREKQWKRMFRRNLPAVVSMDHTYLARYDGSEQAAGRGQGADVPQDRQPGRPPMTPYMQMTYYPLERRLDTAIFRALFASSVRQARQFVVHGRVKVNGKPMIYPGYMLNPGDMFQVNPESVMYATGAPKHQSGNARRVARAKAQERAEERLNKTIKTLSSTKVPLLTDAESASHTAPKEGVVVEPSQKEVKEGLQTLMEEADAALAEDIGAKDKQKLRDFRRAVKKALSIWRKEGSDRTLATLEEQLAFLKERFAPSEESAPEKSAELTLTAEQQVKLKEAFKRLKEEAEYKHQWGKRDPTKPYATPWRPRDYMSAFAFIPRYLEVNQKVCAAVYLRHPVARPGLAEVPTPFGYETGQLAFNWYLKRR